MSKIKITKVGIAPIKSRNGLMGIAYCIINNQFFIGDIEIHTSFIENRFVLIYPGRTLRNRKYSFGAFPINKAVRKSMCDAICKCFKKTFAKYRNEHITFV